MPTVPELWAEAHGLRCVGPRRCFYCGAACDESFPTSRYVRDSFSGRDTCAAPGSLYVCQGCALCFEDVTIPGYAAPQWSREFSWLVTPTGVHAILTALTSATPDAIRALDAEAKTDYRRAQLALLRFACLSPPLPPYALVVTTGGRTHQIYRGVVCHDPARVTLTHDTLRLTYAPAALQARLDLVKQLVAALGKHRLGGSPSGMLVALLEHGYDAARVGALVEAWQQVAAEPLSRLAVFLVPNKEECALEYPAKLQPAGADAGGVRGRGQGAG